MSARNESEAEADERHDARGDTSPGYYSEPRACPVCTGSGSHCPECSDAEDEENHEHQ